jgi:hypothetical protein
MHGTLAAAAASSQVLSWPDVAGLLVLAALWAFIMRLVLR